MDTSKDRLADLSAFISGSHDITADDTVDLLAAINELQQLRAAKAADRERVRDLVGNAIADAEGTTFGSTVDYINSICERVADALAAPVRAQLSEHERCHLLSVKSELSYSTLWRAELATLYRLLTASATTTTVCSCCPDICAGVENILADDNLTSGQLRRALRSLLDSTP